MDTLFGLLAASLAGSVAYLVFWLRSQGRIQAWRQAASESGITDIEAPTILGLNLKLRGKAAGLDVTLEGYSRGKHEHGTRIVIGGLRHGTYGLSVRPEGVTTAIEKTFGEREIEIGDPAFDNAAYLQGSPSLVRAIFTPDTRQALRALLDNGIPVGPAHGDRFITNARIRISDSELTVEIPSSLFNRTEAWLPAILPRLVAMGQQLKRPDDIGLRLADNARRESNPRVRLANLKALTSEYATHGATRETLTEALGDPSPEVRLHAAVSLGAEGQATLLALTAPDVPDGIAAAAIAALGSAVSVEHVRLVLQEARAGGRGATALACLDALGAFTDEVSAGLLVEVVASGPAELAVRAARALGVRNETAAEAVLVTALAHDQAEVRVAAADALGRLGSPLSVVPLRNAADAHRLDGDLRRAARQAIVLIQSRVTGASPGQLTLADAQHGEVTLVAEDERGALQLGTETDQEPAVATDHEARRNARRAQAAASAANRQSNREG